MCIVTELLKPASITMLRTLIPKNPKQTSLKSVLFEGLSNYSDPMKSKINLIELTPQKKLEKNQADTKALYSKPLQNVLSHLFATRLKSQVHHWNLHGLQFYGMHKLLEEVYRSLDDSIDEVAERIRTMGIHTISSFKEIIEFCGSENKSSDKFMRIEEIIVDMNQSFSLLGDAIKSVLNQRDLHCRVTEDLLIKTLGKIEKFGWMVRSSGNN